MNEFSLIDFFFKKPALFREDVIYGIGDDAACLQIPSGNQLLVSTDTLVADVHFLSSWDPYDIAWKALMVNISDMAAMAARPCWLTLALTMPSLDEAWLGRFSKGLHEALNQFNISLIGGDTTRGPLCMTLTIMGVAPNGRAIRRSGAGVGDVVWVSGELGLAAQAVSLMNDKNINSFDWPLLMDKLQHPVPRLDLMAVLQAYATSAIDISDGLSADLNHICNSSGVGASLRLMDIPTHPLVKKYQRDNAISFALSGGDDYELCFTTKAQCVEEFKEKLDASNLSCYQIGIIEETPGLRAIDSNGKISTLTAKGYSHF